MQFNQSLNRLFASGGHVAILRELWHSRREGRTGRELSRLAGLSPAHTARILRGLQDEGIAASRSSGSAFLWTWNDSHVWAAPLHALFSSEANVRNQLIEDLKVTFQDVPVRAVTLFGSVARREERMDSDIDVLIEISGPKSPESVRMALEQGSKLVWGKYGNPLAPLILTTPEAKHPRNRRVLAAARDHGLPILPSG